MYRTIQILALVGILLGAYLLFEQITQSPFRPCNINSVVNCNAVISGEVSHTFGTPTPLIGLVGYIFILISATFHRKKVLLWMASFGLIFCLWIAYKELFLLHVICPICVACQSIMITIFILSVFLQKRTSQKTDN